MNNQSDLLKELNSAVGEYEAQMKAGKTGHSDISLYDFIVSGRKGKTAAEKSIIKRILVIKKKCRITDDELKETVNQTVFPEPIPPRVIKLGILIDVLQERYGERWL